MWAVMHERIVIRPAYLHGPRSARHTVGWQGLSSLTRVGWQLMDKKGAPWVPKGDRLVATDRTSRC